MAALAVTLSASDRSALILGALDRVRICALMLQRGIPKGRIETDDLISAGYAGLIAAARRYDGRVQFGTFAQHRIVGAMKDYLRSVDPVTRWVRAQAKVAGVEPDRITFVCAHLLYKLADTKPGFDETVERRQQCEYLIGKLPQRLALLIRRRYLEDQSQSEVAAGFGVTVGRISQLEGEAMDLLRAEAGRN